MSQDHIVLQNKSIVLQLLILVFGIFLITIFSFTITVYHSLGSDLTHSIRKSLSSTTLALSEKINSKFSELSLDIGAWGTLDVMDDIVTRDVDGRIGRMLYILKLHHKLAGDIYVFNTKGVLVASSNPSGILRQTQIHPPKTWLLSANQPRFIDKNFDPYKNENVVAFCQEIKASFKNMKLGTIVLTYPWSKIANALAEKNNPPLILTGDGTKILYADKRFTAESKDALIEAIDDRADWLTLDGTTYLVATDDSNTEKQRLPDGWNLTAFSPKSVAYEPIHSLGLQIRRLTLMLSVPLALLIILVTRYWVRPIKQLTETVADITTSMDLSKRVPDGRRDEVGLLAKAFNTMTGKLQHTLEENSEIAKKLEEINKNLELKVAQRTEQYSIANQELSQAMSRLEATQSQLVKSEKITRAHNRVLELLAKSAPLPEILHAVVNGVESENAPMLCCVLLPDKEGRCQVTCAAYDLPDLQIAAMGDMAYSASFGSGCSAVFAEERMIVEDMQKHPDNAELKEFASQAGLRAFWSQPIHATSGKVLGTFVIYRRKAGTPNENDIQLLESTANLCGIAIERKHSEAELQLASLVFQNSSEAMVITDAKNAITTINPAFTEVTGYTLEEVVGHTPSKFSSGRHDPAFFQAMWDSLNTYGHWQGEIWNRRKNGEIFAEWLTINTILDEDGSVLRYVALFSDITEKKKNEELIWQKANFDSLTGLPNRHMFRDRLERGIKKAQRADQSLALLFLDLDDFKDVNDTLGHDIGDLLLKEAAKRLTGCVRGVDTVTRLGGDEFTIILGELDELISVERVAQEILHKLAEPYHLKDAIAHVTASIGIAVYPTDAEEIELLLKNADLAMYASKHQGGNRFNYFTVAMRRETPSTA